MFKKFSQILLILTFGLFFSFSFAFPVFAQSEEQNQDTVTRPPIIPGQNQEILIPHQTGDANQDNYLINRFLPSVASTIITITGGLALVFAVFNGIMMIASGGDPEKFSKAVLFLKGGKTMQELESFYQIDDDMKRKLILALENPA